MKPGEGRAARFEDVAAISINYADCCDVLLLQHRKALAIRLSPGKPLKEFQDRRRYAARVSKQVLK
jgi:hypothetical protein